MPESGKKYDPARAAVIEIMGLVEAGKHTTDEATHEIIRAGRFAPLDIRFIRQLANGTIKLKKRLDHDMRFFLSKPSEKLPRKMTDILRLGFYQIFLPRGFLLRQPSPNQSISRVIFAMHQEPG